MNLLRGIALLLAIAALSFSGKLAYAQQEVDPDHFDGPAAHVQKATAPARHNVKRSHASVASKAKHHHKHASA